MWLVAVLSGVLAAAPAPAPGKTPAARGAQSALPAAAAAPTPTGARYPSEEALRRYLQGRSLEEIGESEEALAEYFRAIVLDDGSPAILRRASETALGRGDLARALEFAERALAADSADARAHWLRGTVLLHQGRDADALPSLRTAASRDSERAEYVRTLARAADRLEEWRLSRDAYRRAAWLEPDDPELWFDLATAEARLGRYGAADTALREATDRNSLRPGLHFLSAWVAENLGRNEEAVGHYRIHLRVHPDDLPARRQLAFALRRLKRPREALAEARLLAKQQPEAMEAQVMHADFAFEAKQAGEAMRVLDAMSRLAPGDREVRVMRVLVLGRHGRGAQAAAEAEKALAANPRDLHDRMLAARAQQLAGRTERAAAHLGAAIAQVPDSLGPRVLLGQLYQDAGRWREALAAWRETRALFPDHLGVTFAYAECLERLGQLGDAEQVLREVLEREPDNPTALNFLGYLFANHGIRLEEAVGLVQRALARDPDNGAYLDSLGWAYFRLGRYEEARKLLERAVILTGGDPVIHDHLGDVYKALRLNDLARDQYRLSLDAGSKDPGVRTKLDGLR